MPSFKFNRRSLRRRSASDEPADADDDDEPMRGTSFKKGGRTPLPGGYASPALPGYERRAASGGGGEIRGGQAQPRKQRQSKQSKQMRSRSVSAGRGEADMKNYAGSNTCNKSSQHLNSQQHPTQQQKPQQQSAKGKGISWISDTCSETDVTDTWSPSFFNSSGDTGGTSDSGFSEHGSGYTRDDHVHDDDPNEDEGSSEGGSAVEEGGGDDSYSEESGILFTSTANKRATDEDESYSSVGDHVTRGYREKAAIDVKADMKKKKKKQKQQQSLPPPPKNRTGAGGATPSLPQSGGTGGSKMIDNGVGESTDSRGDCFPGNGPFGSSKSRGGNKSKDGGGGSSSRRSRSLSKGRLGDGQQGTAAAGGGNNSNRGSNNSRGSKVEGLSSSLKGESTAGGHHSAKGISKSASVPKMMHTNNEGQRQQQQQQQQPTTMKLKPPSMMGMPGNTTSTGNKHRQRSHSIGSAPNLRGDTATVATSSTTQSAPDSPEAMSEPGNVNSNTEAAAMQQLAYLVVSLRSDLKDANTAKEDMERKLERMDRPQTELEKENADLQADLEAFIAEQDDMKNEIKSLHEDKASLNDIISRLKREASVERKASSGGQRSNSSNSGTNMNFVPYQNNQSDLEEVQARVEELTDENHKLEREIQLLVGEKSQLVSSSDSRSCEIQELSKSLNESSMQAQEKARVVDEMQERIDTLEKSLENVKKEEGAKMTLLRSRLSQVEKQKGELAEKNVALDGVMLGLKRKVEELVKERNGSATSSHKAAASDDAATTTTATEGDTVLNLQKMISSLESTKERLGGDLDRSTAKISQLESKLKIHEQLAVSEGGSVGSEGSLQGRLADLTVANEALQKQLTEMENEKSRLGSSMEDFLGSKRSLEEVNQVSIDTIQTLQKMISQLESAKEALEGNLHEATDAIGMLEDELDRKDVQVRELLVKLTQQQQLFSQVDKCKTALAERNAKLSSENDDLNTQVKVLIIEKKVASEEIETLKTMKAIADEDEEEELLSRQEQRQEVDNLIDQLEIERAKNNERVSTLEQQVYTLEESKGKLEEELDESSDAIAVLREALTEMQDGSSSRGGGSGEGEIEELQAKTLREKEELMDTESSQAQLEDENRANVETIAALRSQINRLESTKEDLQEEFTTSTLELVDLKEQMKKKGTLAEVTDLEDKLAKSLETNEGLECRIKELTEANDKMKDQVKDLGTSLSSAAGTNGVAPAKNLPLSTSSSDPAASCEVLISELNHQIHDIVSARNVALRELESLKNDDSSVGALFPSDAAIPSPVNRSAVDKKPDPSFHDPDSDKKKLEPAEGNIPSTPSSSSGKKQSTSVAANSSAASHAPSHISRGSSLLEAAKKKCKELDDKRSQKEETSSEKKTNDNTQAAGSSVPPREEPVMKNIADPDIEDNVSAREVKEDVPPNETEKSDGVKKTASFRDEDKKDGDKASRHKGRFDIDQLTSIYFEKCGMSVSRFSDLSSDSSSFRRSKKAPNKDAVTKKVKICRNGVFMGTYEGDLNAGGQRHGFGVLLCDNGNSYEGEWKNDKRDGLGIARYSSGDVYDGQWVRGKREGHGVMYIEAGDTYIGSWNNGLKHGAGTYHWADGEVDVSWYQEDRRVGEGVRWNASRSKAYRLIRGTKKEELSLDEAYVTAEKLGLNLEKFDSGVP